MNNKHWILTILFALAATVMQAVGDYKNGDKLFVCASSGLIFREGPSQKSAKIMTIPYGQGVIVADTMIRDKPFEVNEARVYLADVTDENGQNVYKYYKIKGYWVKVNYGNRRGYVFDGYLSRLPAIKKLSSDTIALEGVVANLNNYCSKNLKFIRKIRDKSNPDDSYRGKNIYTYNGNVDISISNSGTRIEISDISLEEAYLFATAMYGISAETANKDEYGWLRWSESKPDEMIFEVNQGGSPWNGVWIKKEKNIIIIALIGNC